MTYAEQKAKTEFEKYAKETIELKELGGSLYAFGSELACLRIGHVYRHCAEKAAVGYSQNLQSWYFRLETD